MTIKFVFKDEVVEQDIEQDTLIQIKLLKGEKGDTGDTGEQRKSRNTREWNSKYNQNWYKWIDRYLYHNIYKWRY